MKKLLCTMLAVMLVFSLYACGSQQSSDTQKVGEISNSNAAAGNVINSAAVNNASEPFSAENTSENNNASGNAGAVDEDAVFKVGDILKDKDMQIVYISSGVYHSDNSFMQPKEGNQYIFLKFAFTNLSKKDDSVSTYSFEAYADGFACEAFYGGDDDLSATLSSGRTETGCVYFEVPKDAKDIEIEYEPNIFSDRKVKFIYEGDRDSGYVPIPVTTRTEGAYSAGDIIEGKGYRITYVSAEPFAGSMFEQPHAGCSFITITLEFENTSSSDRSVTSLSFDAYADGLACRQVFTRDDDLSATISAGRKARGTVTFEIPSNASVVEYEFSESFWTSGRVIFTVR